MVLRSSGDRRKKIIDDGEADVSYLVTVPQQLEVAAQHPAGIRSSLAGSAASALTPTTAVAAAAQDEISTVFATIFNDFGKAFQALNAQAQAFHEQFLNLMNASAGAYLSAEANAKGRLAGG